MPELPPLPTAEQLRVERGERRSAFANLLRREDIDVAVLSHAPTITYFTGNEIAASAVLLVTSSGDYRLLCDEYDAYNFASTGDGIAISPVPYWESAWEAAGVELRDGLAGPRLGIETGELRAGARDTLARHVPGASFVPVDGLIGDLRLVKSPVEIACIRHAAAAVQTAYAGAHELLAGPTGEPELATRIYTELIAHGSEQVASQPYVKSGERALLTHARWGRRSVAPGDHVTLEIGAAVHRYHAALMRTRLAERSPSAEYARAVEAVVAGRDAYLDVLRPGITAGELHEHHLRALDQFGVRSWNRHGTGYSLGLAFPPYWGELPLLFITKGVERRLEPSMVLHVISGLTEPDAGVPHIGLSECVLITETGFERLIDVPDFL